MLSNNTFHADRHSLGIYLLSLSDSMSRGAEEHTFREALFGPLPAGLIGVLVEKITLQDKVNCQLVHTTNGLVRALLKTQEYMCLIVVIHSHLSFPDVLAK